ncbi:MAG: serine/threonine-protein kinase, partial [Gemmatimonadota bacterium]
MDSSRRKRVEELFDAVVDLEPDARSAYLDEHCSDPSLREDVAALLRAHERAEGVLEGSLARAAAAAVLDAPVPTGAESASEGRIGPYLIRDELGRGGMGVVYLAERSDGQFRRRVALKVIRADHDADLRARVVAERQILASLDHPNIVKLLDAGTTGDGRTYLVMEHVSGLPLDLYCDRMRLSVRERVRLFVAVARGVEHAHHNLVVHRDLKPSNILVTAEGRVKILDFGIAKLLNPALAGVDAPVTRQESRVLTPEYASPEQLRGEALTTASDVYSLGVLLYRLLTGHPPHDPADGTVSAVLSAMLDQDPERPSVKATRPRTETRPDGSTATRSPLDLAFDRRSTSHRLPRTLAGDLDAIVMKALRKEPTRRYGSAESMAQDLESYLRGEPVAAHKDT